MEDDPVIGLLVFITDAAPIAPDMATKAQEQVFLRTGRECAWDGNHLTEFKEGWLSVQGGHFVQQSVEQSTG
jgi:hypothetical protein